MFRKSMAFSGFSVGDLSRAKEFYGTTLDLDVKEDKKMGLLTVKLATGGRITAPVTRPLPARCSTSPGAISTRRWTSCAKGIVRGSPDTPGPSIAWFKDPAGNILSVVQDG